MATRAHRVPHQDRYRLEAVPLGRGGFAEVFRATAKSDGHVVALKRARSFGMAGERLKREIEVQRSLAHPNIMPILDSDPGFTWFTMPVAEGNLDKLRASLDEEDLASILLHVADALQVAHDEQLIHRDISPGNILGLQGSGASRYRWVVADWGLVHRPPRGSSTPLTKAGVGMGTEGFAAPEIWRDATSATPAADVYSLGRVAAWFLTGQRPSPGEPLLPEGQFQHWRGFIRACTESRKEQRLATMADLKVRLDIVFALRDEPPATQARKLVDRLLLGSDAHLDALTSLAADHVDNSALFIDHLARVPTGRVKSWVADKPQEAAHLAQQMVRHLLHSPWEDRDPRYAGTPLAFVHSVLQALINHRRIGLAEDLAEDFFAAEARWQHGAQRIRTIEWMADLNEEAGTAMARAFADRPAVIAYYQQPASWACQSTALGAVLRSPVTGQ
ncbi:serine/threonine-protein kinase [Actinomadura sp. NPDC023710]|uniref:serine/threonine-protein kinase n=1 Tax=Actinomadura sp. NPDC023710 TaxID=3158219 RepID=UPI00340C5075